MAASAPTTSFTRATRSGQDVGGGAVRERRVHEQLHPAHHLGHALGLGARRLLAEQRLPLLPAPDPLGEVPDERREHHLVADAHAMEGLLRREGGAVPALQLELHLHHLERLGRPPSAALAARRARPGPPPGRSGRAAGCRSPLPAGQPNRRSAAVFQAVTRPRAAVDRHERVRRGVEQEPDAGLALAQLARTRLRRRGLAPEPREQARHQQPGHRGGADARAASAAAGRPGSRAPPRSSRPMKASCTSAARILKK